MKAADPFLRALIGDAGEQTVSLARTYAAPIAEVWSALTTPDRIARWYGVIEGDAPRAVGDAFRVDIGAGAVRRARLEGCDAPTALSYTWWSGDVDPGLVRIGLEAIGERETRVRVRHDRLRPHRTIAYGSGWEQNLVALAGVVAGGEPGADIPAEARARRWELMRSHPLRLELRIDAPVDAVWAAWTSADALAAWWWTHWDDVAIAADVREGGGYLIEAARPGIVVSGEYLVVEPKSRLAFTWIWADDEGASHDEAVDVTFHAADGATTVVVRHTGPWDDAAPADSYRQGWEFVLAELARSLRSEGPPGRAD